MDDIIVAITSYDRPSTLELVLRRLLSLENTKKIVVMADASTPEILRAYEEILPKNSEKIEAGLNLGRKGSTKARNALLKLVAKNVGDVKYVLLMDDDFLLPRDNVLQRMIDDLKRLDNVGVVGGRVVNLQTRPIDPEFFLNVPKKVAEWLTKVSGFRLDSKWHKVNYAEGTSSFMLIRSDLLGKISYDENYQGTGYREETDLQLQISRLGFKIISDDRAYVYHLPIEEGGNRDRGRWSQRMYWKARNHTYFILKWNGYRLAKGLWYMLMGTILLILYRPFCFYKILQGLQHGYKLWLSCKQLA